MDDYFLRNSDLLLARFVIDVDLGYFRRNAYYSACSLSQKGDLRRCGSVPLHTGPCRFTGTLRGHYRPPAVTPRPTNSIFPYTPIRKNGAVVALWTTTFYGRAICFSPDLSSMVVQSTFEGAISSKGARYLRQQIRSDSEPCLSSLVLAGLLPRCG